MYIHIKGNVTIVVVLSSRVEQNNRGESPSFEIQNVFPPANVKNISDECTLNLFYRLVDPSNN